MMPKLLPITCRSAMLTLAYIQHYNCKFIPGRCLTNTHLRHLTAWLGCPDNTLRTIRRQPALAAHIALLQAANLLQHNDAFWYLLPDALNWLNQSAPTQYDQLLKPIINGQYRLTVETLGLSNTVPIDMIAYIQQQLAHQNTTAAIRFRYSYSAKKRSRFLVFTSTPIVPAQEPVPSITNWQLVAAAAVNHHPTNYCPGCSARVQSDAHHLFARTDAQPTTFRPPAATDPRLVPPS